MNLGKTTMPILLFAGQVTAVMSLIPMFMYANLAQWLLCFIIYQCIVTIGVSIGYHRYIAHKSFETNVVWQIVMMFFAHIMMIGSAILWVSNHREHHKYSDTDKDPHSPEHKGYVYAHCLQVFTHPRTRYMIDLIRNPVYKYQHKYYWEILALWAIVLYLIDPFAVIYAWLAPAGISKIFGSLVYSFSHRQGKPHNDIWVALLSGGEGFHEVHHNNTRLTKWHNLDTGGLVIDLIKK